MTKRQRDMDVPETVQYSLPLELERRRLGVLGVKRLMYGGWIVEKESFDRI